MSVRMFKTSFGNRLLSTLFLLLLWNQFYANDRDETLLKNLSGSAGMEGALVKSAGSSSFYLVHSGRKRLITPFVLRQLGFEEASAQTMGEKDLAQIPSGSAIPPKDGTLLKSEETSIIFFVAQEQLHSVSRFVFVHRKFKNKDLIRIKKNEVDQWPHGKPLPPPDGMLLRGAVRPAVYLIQEGKRFWVDMDVFKVRKFDFKSVMVIPDSELENLEYHQLDFPNKTLVRILSDPTVFVFLNGSMRGINLPFFKKCNFRFEEVNMISPSKFKTYPRGADLTESDCPLAP